MVLCVLGEHCGKADLEAAGLLFYDQSGCDFGMFVPVLDEGGTAKGRSRVTTLVSCTTSGWVCPWDLVIPVWSSKDSGQSHLVSMGHSCPR